jgi:hypothetical protein
MYMLRVLMLANYDPDWNIADLSDTEIYAAIRYLELGTSSANEQKSDARTTPNFDKDVVICVFLYIAVLVCLAFLWFYFW